MAIPNIQNQQYSVCSRLTQGAMRAAATVASATATVTKAASNGLARIAHLSGAITNNVLAFTNDAVIVTGVLTREGVGMLSVVCARLYNGSAGYIEQEIQVLQQPEQSFEQKLQ